MQTVNQTSGIPFDLEAEAAVLGSMIIDPDAIMHVYDRLYPEDFYRHAHREVYKAILSLYEQRINADFITICDELERDNKLEEEVGGANYIVSLVNQVPTSGNIDFYADIVIRDAQLRALIFAAGQIAAMAGAREEDTVKEAERLIYDVTQRRRKRTVYSMSDALSTYMEKLSAVYEANSDGAVSGVATDLIELDNLTGGYQKSDLITIAARPSIGKTAFAMSNAAAAARKGEPVLIFSLEMSKEQLIQRYIADATGIPSQRLRRGDLSDNDWQLIAASVGELSQLPIYIEDTPGITPLHVLSQARHVQAEHGLSMIVVDYLQLMKPVGKHENRVQEVSSLSRDLKNIARELNVPVLMLSQLNRGVETRADPEPKLSDLRESGAIEQDSDVVIFLYVDQENVERKRENRKYLIHCIVAKQRNGPVNDVVLQFNPSRTRFENRPASAVPVVLNYDE